MAVVQVCQGKHVPFTRSIGRFGVIAILGLAASAKLMGALSVSVSLTDRLGSASLAALELVIALQLLRQRWLIVTAACLAALAIGGAAQAIFSAGPCRCFGDVIYLTRKAHLALSCALGMFAVLAFDSSVFLRGQHNGSKSSGGSTDARGAE